MPLIRVSPVVLNVVRLCLGDLTEVRKWEEGKRRKFGSNDRLSKQIFSINANSSFLRLRDSNSSFRFVTSANSLHARRRRGI